MSSLWLRCFIFVRSIVRSFVTGLLQSFSLVYWLRESRLVLLFCVRAAPCEKLTFAWKRRGVTPRARTCPVQSAFAFAFAFAFALASRCVRGSGIAVAPSCGGAATLCVSAFNVCERTRRDSLGLCSARSSVLRPSVRSCVRSSGTSPFWSPRFLGHCSHFPGTPRDSAALCARATFKITRFALAGFGKGRFRISGILKAPSLSHFARSRPRIRSPPRLAGIHGGGNAPRLRQNAAVWRLFAPFHALSSIPGILWLAPGKATTVRHAFTLFHKNESSTCGSPRPLALASLTSPE